MKKLITTLIVTILAKRMGAKNNQVLSLSAVDYYYLLTY